MTKRLLSQRLRSCCSPHLDPHYAWGPHARRHLHGPVLIRSSSTSSPDISPGVHDFSFDSIRETLLGHPPKFLYDYLSPTSSHLLNAALADHIPATYQPTPYQHSPIIPYQFGTPLPQGHHLTYFPLQSPASQLAPDGADRDHAAGRPFVRRMWAGGELRFSDEQLILDGGPALCMETIEAVRLKDGDVKGKEKVFVDVWRRYLSGSFTERPDEEVVRAKAQIEERRTLVFMRSEPASEQPLGSKTGKAATQPRSRPGRKDPAASFSLTPDPFLLFHFSALSYNTHFIHYERTWTQAHEGYKDLLVHGPLSLTLLFAVLRPLLAAQETPTGKKAIVRRLEYRNLAPLFCGERMTVCASENGGGAAINQDGGKWDVWVEGPEGGLAVRGKAESVLIDA